MCSKGLCSLLDGFVKLWHWPLTAQTRDHSCKQRRAALEVLKDNDLAEEQRNFSAAIAPEKY